MAQRRMLSLRIVDSARFLQMPLTAHALYFHLALHADDDGVVESFPVMRTTGAAQDDLRILLAKKFIHQLNDIWLFLLLIGASITSYERTARPIVCIKICFCKLYLAQTLYNQNREQTLEIIAEELTNNLIYSRWTVHGQSTDGIG
jgi:hypothetical protein